MLNNAVTNVLKKIVRGAQIPQFADKKTIIYHRSLKQNEQ